MDREKWLLPVLFLAAATSTGSAAEERAVGGQMAPQSQSILFATPLLSESEQADYRASIRAAKDAAERERIRAAHYELMKARAKERGHALPENRPAAVGEAGGAFGPSLNNEAERAARRASARSPGSAPADDAIRPTRVETAPATALPGPPEKAAVSGQRAGAAKPDNSVKVVTPSSSSATPAEPTMGAVVLPGIDTLFGPQLASEEERAAFRARLRAAKSDGERQAIRAERDQLLRLRAKEQGVTLPQ